MKVIAAAWLSRNGKVDSSLRGYLNASSEAAKSLRDLK